MKESIFQAAEQINQLHKNAYDIYLPLIDDLCRQEVPEDELSHVLDYLLDFACNEKTLELYKRVCRRNLHIYSSCIKFYVEAYQEMWEEELDR